VVAGGRSLQRRSSVVDEDRVLISGPAIVIILEDDRLHGKWFDFSLMKVGMV
jgi:hypothetical protein